MTKKFLSILLLCLSLSAVGQKVTNARFEQVGKQVEITYTLDKTSDISVYLSTDGGKTFGTSPLKALTGDAGKQVSAGQKKVLWSPLDEREKIVSDNVVFKIVPSGAQVKVKDVTVNGAHVKNITVNGVTFQMVYVEGGTFTMGCTGEQGGECDSDVNPLHKVTVSSYYIGKTEVTQGLWQAVMGSNPSYFKKGNDYPVEVVSWDDCQQFISRLKGLTGLRFSLPTEAQWEFAARGGVKSQGYKYAGSNNLGSVAWYDYNSGASTHPVATKSPNELGLFDMSGNVWEWCQDWFGSYSSSSQSNPTGPSSGGFRVHRGGSWYNNAQDSRVADRDCGFPEFRNSIFGFRVVLLP